MVRPRPRRPQVGASPVLSLDLCREGSCGVAPTCAVPITTKKTDNQGVTMNMFKTRIFSTRLTLFATLCAGALTLSSTPAAAAPGWSWNLSRDMILDFASAPVSNPLGPWTFMEEVYRNPCAYFPLPDATSDHWYHASYYPFLQVGV